MNKPPTSESVIDVADEISSGLKDVKDSMRLPSDRRTSPAIERKWQEQQRIIDEQNRMRRELQAQTYGRRRATAYKLSVAQEMDHRAQSQNLEFMAQDFVHAAGQRMQRQSVAYSRSGALMAGSALARTKQTKDEGEQGAARLRMAAETTRKRGKMLSKITREGVVKPAFIPISDAIRDPYMPDRQAKPQFTMRMKSTGVILQKGDLPGARLQTGAPSGGQPGGAASVDSPLGAEWDIGYGSNTSGLPSASALIEAAGGGYEMMP